MNLIIETDLGHDPDDFFAICYLILKGVDIRAILISPGDPDQIAIAKLITQKCGLDIPIGVGKLDRNTRSSGSIHHKLLKKHKQSLDATHDGFGVEVINDTIKSYPDCEFFIIGPVTSIGLWLRDNEINTRATMQGGFLPYGLNPYDIQKIEKFENKDMMPTFNLNGSGKSAQYFLNNSGVQRNFVGKHICHTVVADPSIVNQFKQTKHPASVLFKEGLNFLFDNHKDKRFHDPTAAVCHLYPEIAQWVSGETIKVSGGWTTEINEFSRDKVAANINYNLLWESILQ